MDLTILGLIQHLHDFSNHWNERGLTEDGKRYYNTVKEEILYGELYEPVSKISI